MVDTYKFKRIAVGLASWVPGAGRLRTQGTGGTVSARYCYSVWLRHLKMAEKNGFNTSPNVVAELGPGDSLGIGLLAILTGANQYFAFDALPYANMAKNLEILDQLVELLKSKEPVPGPEEFPKVKPFLEDYSFPHDILTGERIGKGIAPERLEWIRKCLENTDAPDSPIQYRAPWDDGSIVEDSTVDMIFSQAVLEHVNDLDKTYRTMKSWIRPGGFLSHQIDFKCHGMAREWNGHWKYSDLEWKMIKGNTPYLINREPASTHLRLLKENGFQVKATLPVRDKSSLAKTDLAPRFRTMTDEDLLTSGLFVQASTVE